MKDAPRQSVAERALGWLLVVLMAASVLNVLWQVFTRFALSDPSPYTEELARYLLIWIGLLGAAYATGQRMHLAIDLLPARLSGASRRVLAVLIELCILSFALGILTTGGLRLVLLTLRLGQTSAALGIPLGWVYLALPVSGVLIAGFALRDLVALGRRGDAP